MLLFLVVSTPFISVNAGEPKKDKPDYPNYADTLYTMLQDECVNKDTTTDTYCDVLKELYNFARTKKAKFAKKIQNLKNTRAAIPDFELKEFQRNLFKICLNLNKDIDDSHKAKEVCKHNIAILFSLAGVPYNHSL